jgi:hypothetical protein
MSVGIESFRWFGFGAEGSPAANIRLGLVRVWLFPGTVFEEIARLKEALRVAEAALKVDDDTK